MGVERNLAGGVGSLFRSESGVVVESEVAINKCR